jgi:hypothetical protein
MRSITLFIFILCVLQAGNLNAQTTIKADPAKWTAYNSQAVFNEGTIHLTNLSGKTALLWLNHINFENGIVELDIKGKDLKGESFIGVAFHAADSDHYDAVYFRPFTFRDPETKDRAVQYIDMPDHDWDVLREQHPGKYEHAVNPVPDPGDWFHVKLVIHYPAIKVYINGTAKPTLEVEQLSKRKEGKLGLWLDSQEGWFRKVVVTHIR